MLGRWDTLSGRARWGGQRGGHARHDRNWGMATMLPVCPCLVPCTQP